MEQHLLRLNLLAAVISFVMDDDENPHIRADHASVIVGWGFVEEEDQQGQWRLLRNAHCNDRKRVRWDYGIQLAEDDLWAYHVSFIDRIVDVTTDE